MLMLCYYGSHLKQSALFVSKRISQSPKTFGPDFEASIVAESLKYNHILLH